jgi:hypothetical protein
MNTLLAEELRNILVPLAKVSEYDGEEYTILEAELALKGLCKEGPPDPQVQEEMGDLEIGLDLCLYRDRQSPCWGQIQVYPKFRRYCTKALRMAPTCFGHRKMPDGGGYQPEHTVMVDPPCEIYPEELVGSWDVLETSQEETFGGGLSKSGSPLTELRALKQDAGVKNLGEIKKKPLKVEL